MRPILRLLSPLALALTVAGPAFARSVERARVEGWQAVAGERFTVLTDAGAARGREVLVSLESFRSALARLAPAMELRSPAPLTVLAFRDASTFAPYKAAADPDGGAILGQFIATPDGNFLALDTRSTGGDTGTALSEVVIHELVHDLLRHNLPGIPPWLDEGLAEHYSTFVVEGGGARLGRPIDRHLEWLRQEGDWGIDGVLRAGSAIGDRHEAVPAGRFYAVSWALASYLLADSARLDRLAEVLGRVADGDPADEAFGDVFDLDDRALEGRLRAFLDAGVPETVLPLDRLPPVRPRVAAAQPADVAVRLGDLLAHVGRLDAAEGHFVLALDLEPQHPEAHAAMALVRDREGRRPEAAILHDDARRLGSRSAWSRLLYGRHLLLRASEEPEAAAGLGELARRVLDEATAIDPRWGEVWILLGRAHLVGDADSAAGVRALGQARRLLPDRPDVPFFLALLEIRRGGLAAAAGHVRELVAVAPELAEKAGAELDFARAVRAARAAFDSGDSGEGLRLLDEAVALAPDVERRQEVEAEVARLRSLD